jgi:hypothetical protein
MSEQHTSGHGKPPPEPDTAHDSDGRHPPIR